MFFLVSRKQKEVGNKTSISYKREFDGIDRPVQTVYQKVGISFPFVTPVATLFWVLGLRDLYNSSAWQVSDDVV